MSEIGTTYCLGSVFGTIDFTWIIDDFSELDADIQRAYNSKRYNLAGYEKGKAYWYLRIKPGGESNDSTGFISLFLLYKTCSEETFRVELLSNIRNAEGETLCRRQTSTHNFSSGDGFGFPKLIRRDKLIKKLRGDRLIINVKVNYSASVIRDVYSVKLILDDGSLHTKFHEDFKVFLKNKETSDAVISVGGVDFPVHTSILSARSKVFAAMFKQETIENTSRRVVITDFKADTVESLLEFIYSASVDDISVDLALDLLRAADKYGVDDLMEYCSNYLMARTDDKNIVRILAFADMCNASRLREESIEYFCAEKGKFGSEDLFSSVSQKLLLDIIKRLKGI